MKLPIEELQRVHQMLNAIPFMQGLGQREIEELAYNLNLRHFVKEETIIREGEPGKHFYLVSKGGVAVYRKRFFSRTKLASLGPGDFFGEMALIENAPRNATVVGEDDGEMYSLTREGFERVLMNHPAISDIIRKTAAERKTYNIQHAK